MTTQASHLCILKEAFPNTDIDLIETLLGAYNNNLENTFESLLSISDPTYLALREQIQLDQKYAKALIMQEESRAETTRQILLSQQQYTSYNHDNDSTFNLQEGLPIIREKMMVAGSAAKKKVLDLYYQFTQRNNQDQYDIYITNAHYRGLPGDDTDDLLTGDISAFHLSDDDVYTKTTRQLNNRDMNIREKETEQSYVIGDDSDVDDSVDINDKDKKKDTQTLFKES